MTMSLEEIRALIQDLEQSSLREFVLEDGDFSLRLSKNELAPITAAPIAMAATDPVSATSDSVAIADPFEKTETTTVTINSPLVGTVYLRANPDAKPFKQVGERVVVGEQVAIVEAMKLMTPVKSEVAGVITEILVEEEQVVDFDKPMFRVDPKG